VCFREKRYVEENTVQQAVMIPAKEVKLIIYQVGGSCKRDSLTRLTGFVKQFLSFEVPIWPWIRIRFQDPSFEVH
jgi:hypothetical protein